MIAMSQEERDEILQRLELLERMLENVSAEIQTIKEELTQGVQEQ